MAPRLNQSLTITEIIEAFPDECRTMIPRVNRALKKQLKPYHDHCKSINHKLLDNFSTLFLKRVIKMEYRPEIIEERIRQNELILRILDQPKDENRITDHMITQAKEVPLAMLYSFEQIRPGTARYSACCPFHIDKNPSFVVYPNNTFYCFSCHSGGDSIEFIKKLHDMNFIEAVKFILKK